MKALSPLLNHYTTENKLCIKSALLHFASVMDEHEAASLKLSQYVNHDHIEPIDAVNRYIRQVIKFLCDEAQQRAKNRSQLEITPSMLPSQYSSYDIRKALGADRHDSSLSTTDICTKAYERLNVGLLNTEIDKLIGSIELTGFAEAADRIANFLGLIRYHSDKAPLVLMKSKGMVGVEVSLYNSHWDRKSRLAEQANFAGTMERETGTQGYREALRLALLKEEELSGYDAMVPSRTRVRVRDDIEIVFFISKMKFFFAPELFETLWAFLKEYCTSDLVELES